jgi:hypothetical protein
MITAINPLGKGTWPASEPCTASGRRRVCLVAAHKKKAAGRRPFSSRMVLARAAPKGRRCRGKRPKGTLRKHHLRVSLPVLCFNRVSSSSGNGFVGSETLDCGEGATLLVPQPRGVLAGASREIVELLPARTARHLRCERLRIRENLVDVGVSADHHLRLAVAQHLERRPPRPFGHVHVRVRLELGAAKVNVDDNLMRAVKPVTSLISKSEQWGFAVKDLQTGELADCRPEAG